MGGWVVKTMPWTLYFRDPVPMYRKLGGFQGQSGRMRKISPPPGFHPRVVQPVVSLYTDWAIQAISLFMAVYLTTVYLQHIIQHRMCENSHYKKTRKESVVMPTFTWGDWDAQRITLKRIVCAMVVFEPDITSISVCNKSYCLSKIATSKLLRSAFNFFFDFQLKFFQIRIILR